MRPNNLHPLYRYGIPALALGQGLAEIGFVLSAKAGLKSGDSPILLMALFASVLLRFVFQDRGAALEARALRDTVAALRARMLSALQSHAVPAYRPEERRALERALEEHVPRAAEGQLARRHFEGALLQCALFAVMLVLLSFKTALLGIAFAALVWPVLRWRNRALKTLESAGMTGRGEAKRAREDFGNALEARAGTGLSASLKDLEAALDAAHLPESRWWRAQLRYPALLETGLFFVLTALLVAGSFTLPDWNALLLFSLLLLLAYRPVREAARHYPASVAGAAAQKRVEELAQAWELYPPRALPKQHPQGDRFALHNVEFGYEPGHSVLRNFRADFYEDQVTGITGPNGAGKTTLLRLLAGAEIPRGGVVYWTEAARAENHGIAYLPQRAQPGSDWVAWAARFCDEHPEDWKALDHLLRLHRLHDKAIHPESLSGGERQRMALARTLASDASFLLLDEPTTALPGDERERILRGALEFWTNRVGDFKTRRTEVFKTRRGVLVVSHEPNLESLCDRVIRMQDQEVESAT